MWLAFCLAHIPEALAAPDYIGQAARGDRRRVDFVRLVGRPSRWLLVSVKVLDDRIAKKLGAVINRRRLELYGICRECREGDGSRRLKNGDIPHFSSSR